MTPKEAAFHQLIRSSGYRVLRGGWPDFLVVPPDGGHGFAVELKSCLDQVRPGQAEMHQALEAAGVRVLVVKESAVVMGLADKPASAAPRSPSAADRHWRKSW